MVTDAGAFRLGFDMLRWAPLPLPWHNGLGFLNAPT